MSMTVEEAEMQIIRCIVGACDETCPHYWLDGVCHGSSEVASCAEKALEELNQYRAIGTVSEFRELKEKATAKKVIIKPWNPAKCPSCGASLSESLGDGYYRHHVLKARCDCGQFLDWSEGKE